MIEWLVKTIAWQIVNRMPRKEKPQAHGAGGITPAAMARVQANRFPTLLHTRRSDAMPLPCTYNYRTYFESGSPMDYANPGPTRDEIEALQEPTLLEFGTPWCGHCQRAQPLIAEAMAMHPGVRHIKVEDGSGRRLGRSFEVKLWPTLIFLDKGQEVDALVRPTDVAAIRQALGLIDPTGSA